MEHLGMQLSNTHMRVGCFQSFLVFTDLRFYGKYWESDK